MPTRLDQPRIASFSLIVGCVSQIIWVMLTDILVYIASPHGLPLDYPEFVVHVIWLAPIPALWILRRSPSATILYALSLSALLSSRLYEYLQVAMYGPSVVREMTEADLAATVIGGLSLTVIFFWSAHLLTNLVFTAVQRIVGVLRNG
ncbi:MULTISPECIES: hypothetical protein [unclassified Bradyrhizobium]|uniref:hypothetical protein n=1 Tax=unclassified Bradyrhizobium TaxID=2631580 RepID=UPI0028E37ABE|nr:MULTISPECIES: hypothetical protein [unclassified Bradyrhizobium]